MTRLTILMAVHNGAAHLPEQLASFTAQSHEDWALWAGDDGSDDASAEIVEAFGRRAGHPLRLVPGPRQGAAANFLALLRHSDLPPGPVALADQDDVWFPDHLARGLAALQAAGPGAHLYCARTLVGAHPEGPLRPSPLHRRLPHLKNALIQSLGGGNTMLLSADLVAALRGFAGHAVPHHHDWWLYQFVTAIGGSAHYDPEPALFYRQHHGNQVGRNRGASARLRRLQIFRDGRYAAWIDSNLAALAEAAPLFTAEARATLDAFHALRRLRGAAAVTAWRRLGLYRQHLPETAFYMAAAAAGRL